MDSLPLEGVKVLEFGLNVTVPLACKIMAMYGATVVKVEGPPHTLRFDLLRLYPPFSDGISGLNRSGSFAEFNNGVLSAAIDASQPNGLNLIRRLAGWCDVLVENFSAGTLKRMGLDYDELVKLNPGIILAMSATAGETGPAATQPGTGLQLQSAAGFTHMLGWPDRPPVGSPNAYTDFIAPWYLVTAIMAALAHKMQTGAGQWIDLSQLEASVSFLAPALLDYTVNGRVLGPQGNRCSYAAPHGAYRCSGEDQWCVIAVCSDEEWVTLRQTMGNPAWARDSRFDTLEGRKDNEDYLNQLVEKWTMQHEPDDIVGRLQEVGVAAGKILDGRGLQEDPQLRMRGYFEPVTHPEMGTVLSSTGGYLLSNSSRNVAPSPCLGEHTEYVCTSILGLSDEEFVE